MAGFTSLKNLIGQTFDAGQTYSNYFRIVALNNAPASQGFHFFTANGGSFSGTAGVAVAMNGSTNGKIDSGIDVSSANKYLLSAHMEVLGTASTPATFLLCDFLLYYPSCVLTGTPTTLDNTVTLPRYTNGVGVMGFASLQTAPATTVKITPTFDTDGATGRTNTSLTASLTATSPAQLFSQNVVAANGTMFFALSGADKGVKKVTSYTIVTTDATALCNFVLVKPLAMIACTTNGVAFNKDFICSDTSFPKIEDDACLGLISIVNTTNVPTLMGSLTFGWN